MSTMRAVRFHGVGEPLRVEDVSVPRPGSGAVLVRVAACGVCASDLHVFDGTLPNQGAIPFTPGHEASGVIASIGAGVIGWSEGDRVAMYAGKGCGRCRACTTGRPVEECTGTPLTMGVDYDGAWAEYVVVPAANLVRVPDNVPLEVAAILCDAVATPYNAVIDVAQVRPGERVAIYGIGGLGTHAVMIARMAGAGFIAAIDPNAGARERAKLLGADLVLDPTDGTAPQAIKDATDGNGVDAAFDFVGANAVLKQAVASLAIGGRAVIVGVGGDRIQLGPLILFAVLRTKLLGTYGYQRRHLETLMRLVASGRLDVSSSISARLPIERAAEGVAILSEKRNDPVRVLLVSGDSSSV